MKLSELIKGATVHHYAWGGNQSGMCPALKQRWYNKVPAETLDDAKFFCATVVDAVNPTGGSLFLYHALRHKGFPYDRQTMQQIWLAVIDKLESEGK